LIGEQAVLRQEIARMRTDDEVERIARRDFNFVLPGEEAYAVLPAPPAPVQLPPASLRSGPSADGWWAGWRV